MGIGYALHSGKNSKAGYYLKSGFRDFLPDALFRSRLEAELERGLRLYDPGEVDDRVDYYCHPHPTPLPDGSPAMGSLRRRDHRSAYYFDSRDIVRWFDPGLRWQFLFGDVRDIPAVPTVVKSRNLTPDNGNAVLLKLNRCIHFVFVRDRMEWEAKKPVVLFRGHIGSRENRRRFCELYAGHPRADVGDTRAVYGPDSPFSKPKLTIAEQLRYRYIMSLEGNDVATNLKWILSSRSLAVMPRPTCETWFMEGRLQPGVHYIEVRPDYADLMEQVAYYDAHPDLCRQMADAANAWCDQFRDARRERYIGLRVMQRYLQLTGQL